MSDPVADCLAGLVSPPVAVARLLLGGADAAGIRARVAAARPAGGSDAWTALDGLLAGRGATLDRLAAGLGGHVGGHVGDGASVAEVAAFFDRAAAVSPEAGVALYSLGDPELLAAATAEVTDWLAARGLLRDGMDVLDLGCGIGRMLPALAARARTVLATDVSAAMVAEARARCTPGNVRIEQSDGQGLAAIAPASLDLILAVDSFPYIVAAGLAGPHLQGAARALRPGGTLVILNFSYRGDAGADAADAGSAGLTVVEAGTTPFRLWDGTAWVLRRPVVETVHIADRPDLVGLVAGWLHAAFWKRAGYALEEVAVRVGAGTARSGTPQTFVALVDGVPAATASYSATDLDERPELTPWLAGVYTDPAFRGRDLASHLVRRVERAAREDGHGVLWLYTTAAEGLYLKLGWGTVETVERPGKWPVALMRVALG